MDANNKIDSLLLISGEPIHITDKIVFKQPLLKQVIRFGEQKYYKLLADLTAIPSDIKYILYKNKIDWMEFDDMELFYAFSKSIPESDTSIFFPGIDFSKFILLKTDDGKFVMYNKKDEIIIDFYVFKQIQECLCKSHNIEKHVEKAGNKTTKQVLIEEDRLRMEREKDKPFKSNLFGLISSLVNYPGFKYNYESVKTLTMFQFMDAVCRARIIDSTTHLMNGIYSGNVDVKKISSQKMNWMREVDEVE